MGFVNEFVPEEDIEKYQLAEIDKKFIVGGTNARDWTIDRGREIYLRNVASGGGADPDIRNQTKWTLYWQGTLLPLRLDHMGGGGESGGAGWAHWKLVWMCGTSGLPENLKSRKAQILEDLKEALTVYRSGGVYAGNHSSYSVTLNIAEECAL